MDQTTADLSVRRGDEARQKQHCHGSKGDAGPRLVGDVKAMRQARERCHSQATPKVHQRLLAHQETGGCLTGN